MSDAIMSVQYPNPCELEFMEPFKSAIMVGAYDET